jgi:hypothetical protein
MEAESNRATPGHEVFIQSKSDEQNEVDAGREEEGDVMTVYSSFRNKLSLSLTFPRVSHRDKNHTMFILENRTTGPPRCNAPLSFRTSTFRPCPYTVQASAPICC